VEANTHSRQTTTSAASALGEFLAWLWVPNRQVRARGFATVRLAVFPGHLVITPRFKQDLFNYMLGIPESTEYDWQAVVIERLRPAGQVGVHVEVGGDLGMVAVGYRSQRRLVEALRAAGFAVVERTRWGWEAPRPVAQADLYGYVDQLPACVSAT
jgi:hypothetical protein